MLVDGKGIVVRGRFIKTARVRDKWYEFVEDPEALGIYHQVFYAG